MYYFMSNIHGNYSGYEKMKEKIGFSDQDHLYVIGNIFDGNTQYPEDCIKILDDIIYTPNIELILGDHEFYYIMYYISGSQFTKKQYEQKIQLLKPAGKALFDYLNNIISNENREDIFLKLIRECELSQMIKIGKRYFYLVNGSPVFKEEYKNDEQWQEMLASETIKLSKDYRKEILSDTNVKEYSSDLKNAEIIIISGNSVMEMYGDNPSIVSEQMIGKYKWYQRIIYKNNKIILNCGCRADKYYPELIATLACLCIDEKKEEFSVVYGYDLF